MAKAFKTEPINPKYRNDVMSINISALEVQDNGEGRYCIVLPARELTECEREVLSVLFPRTQDLIEKALATEAMLEAIA